MYKATEYLTEKDDDDNEDIACTSKLGDRMDGARVPKEHRGARIASQRLEIDMHTPGYIE